MTFHLSLIVPGDPGQLTGGYIYDARIVSELRVQGWSVDVIGLKGRFPLPDARARAQLDRALSGLPDGRRVVIDGLALGGLPEVVRDHQRLDLTALVHHPLADETGLPESTRACLLDSERRALASCRRVIVTSHFTARRLAELCLCQHAPGVIEPGVEIADLAGPVARRIQGKTVETSENLLCVASLVPRKGQDVLINALAGLADQPWYCVLAGSARRDPDYAAGLNELIRTSKLDGRIELTGELDEKQLQSRYHQASLCVLPSHYEGYGMVVTEALARGLPLVASTGGALAETVPDQAALKIPPGDVKALQAALARWLDDASLRQQLTGQAIATRDQLPGWSQAGKHFARALTS